MMKITEAWGWILMGTACFLIVIIYLWNLLYDVKLGRLVGFYIAALIANVSPSLGLIAKMLVEGFVWF